MENNSHPNKCKRCGRCMTVCPVYQTTLREADVARGKLVLIEALERDSSRPSPRLQEILSRCLLCGACAQVCANSVKTGRFIQKSRHKIFENRKDNRSQSLLLKNIREGEFSGGIISKGGALLQSLFCKKIPKSSGLHLRFPISFFSGRTTVPSIAWHPFLNEYRPEKSVSEQGLRVGIFLGCGANYLYPESARALVRILKKMGVAVFLPESQVCCGLPAFVSGDTEKARALATRNIEAFSSFEPDAVLTLCASCGSHLKNLRSIPGDDPSWESRVSEFADKHQDAMSFMVEKLDLNNHLKDLSINQPQQQENPMRVAYHDPCHLRIGQSVVDAPRRLLESLHGVELVDAPHEGRCCGHGGDFNLSQFDLSMKILDRRMDDFQSVNPDAIVTGCTGCLLQIAEGLGRKGLGGKVQLYHPLVLVDRVMASRKKVSSSQT